jgi:hypothetical protein
MIQPWPELCFSQWVGWLTVTRLDSGQSNVGRVEQNAGCDPRMSKLKSLFCKGEDAVLQALEKDLFSIKQGAEEHVAI